MTRKIIVVATLTVAVIAAVTAVVTGWTYIQNGDPVMFLLAAVLGGLVVVNLMLARVNWIVLG